MRQAREESFQVVGKVPCLDSLEQANERTQVLSQNHYVNRYHMIRIVPSPFICTYESRAKCAECVPALNRGTNLFVGVNVGFIASDLQGRVKTPRTPPRLDKRHN